MILSMTGYGSSNAHFGDKEIRIEVKAINSKMGDIRFRLPHRYSGLEIQLRRTVTELAHRGKIEVNMNTQSDAVDDEYQINLPLFKSYYKSLHESMDELGATDSSLAAGILKIYNVVRPNTEDISEEERSTIINCLTSALDELSKFRAAEGKVLEDDFRLRCRQIMEKIEQLDPFEEDRTTQVRNRLTKTFETMEKDIEVDRNRFEQELVYYLEKFDITEEKIRLRQHCQYFLQTLDSDEVAKGKSLAFIGQEMGREINTIGSKANNHHIQHLVVQMKEELEKIKEQLANVV